MSKKERVFHSVLFECIALIIMAISAHYFSKHNAALLTGLGLSLSLIAMTWNYFFNIGFDKYFTGERINRTLMTRVLHASLFEIGLLVITIPILMWVLNLGFVTALLLDLGVALFFLVYAITFNWCYDKTRYQIRKSAY